MEDRANGPASGNALESALISSISGEVHFDRLTRLLYSTDASMYQMIPVAVTVPRTVEDVVQIVKLAAEYNTPVLARGSGSSLAGQTVGNAIVVDFTKYLDKIIEIDAESKSARVQPGVVLDDLNAAVAKHGLMFGPDPASSNRATFGGMVANNATGTHSILYGNVIQHVESLEVVLSDGSVETFGEHAHSESSDDSFATKIISDVNKLLNEHTDTIRKGTSKHWRRNSGYRLESLLKTDQSANFASIFCGSEGTLGIVTEAVVKLVEKPSVTGLGVVHFETRREALEAVATILETSPSAVELFDGTTIQQCRKMAGIAERMDFVQGDPGAVLMTEYQGSSAQDIDRGLIRLESALQNSRQGYSTVSVLDPKKIDEAWSVRKEALGFIMGVRGDYQPLAFIEDASVPIPALADYIDDLDEILTETNTPVVYYAHASGGCLHVRPFINLKDSAEIKKMRTIATGSVELVRKYGGAVSSEHGDGLARSEFNRLLVGDELYEVYRKLKAIFDPNNIFNPGKIVDAPLMTENLRYGPLYDGARLKTNLSFVDDVDFGHAVEQCSGVGTCRKLGAGTMCPSFMVTRDEKQSTRGRANALRSALAGDLEEDSFTSEDLYDVMDLCVQCKACKTECPSNVDMAKIKSEWLSQYWKANKAPLRTRIFANFPRMAARMPVRLRRFARITTGMRGVNRALNAILNLSPERSLPPFADRSFQELYSRDPDSSGPPIALFADTFTNYNHPELGLAAAKLLTNIGYSVFVPTEKLCCGRTFMSKGFIDDAQQELLTSIEALYPYASTDIPIVMLEPSCLSMFTDDYKGLVAGEVRAEAIAKAAISFEQLAAEDKFGLFANARWKNDDVEMIVHGHCHQKALEGTEYLRMALEHATPEQITMLDAGCCGMAGSFGYETEHLEVSKRMAERVLVPRLRETKSSTVVVAPGTSCRTQIHDLAKRDAKHPVEALLDRLEI